MELVAGLRWAWCCVLAVALVSSSCEKKKPPAPPPPWATWTTILGSGNGSDGTKPSLKTLASRARSQKRLRPFRQMSEAKALGPARRFLAQATSKKPPPGLLVPPVDWGKAPNNDNNLHMKMNDWRQLIPVAWAHYYTGDERYLNQLERVALDWVDYNLVENKPNAKKWHDMASGLRSVLLAYLIDERLRATAKPKATLPELIWAAAKHVDQLKKPEMFTEGNHGLYVILGLKALLTALPELKGRKALEKYANEKMNHLLHQQYSKEGFHIEHSAAYQVVTDKSMQDIVAIGLFDNTPEVQKRLRLARRVTCQLFHPNGDRLQIGDSERGNGKHIAELKEQREFLRSEGERGHMPPSGLLAYPEVGYALYRSPWSEKPFEKHSYLFFAPGYHSRHHKHASHLSFEWSEAGHPILVDSGKYEYADNKWRKFFMSTRSGNAVEVDGKDHSRSDTDAWGGGLNAWGTVGPYQFMYSNVQYQPAKVKHGRTLILYPREWLCLVDDLSSDTQHTYRQWLHLHEDFEAEKLPDRFVARLPDGMQVFIQPLTKGGELGLELARGQVKPRIQGWLSPRYRQKVKRYSLAFRKTGDRVRFVTLLSLDEPAKAAHVDEIEGGVRVRFARWATKYDFRVVRGSVVEP